MIQADIDDGVPKQAHALDGVVYRSVLSDDFAEIKRLHEEFFPVQYSDQFYVDACNGKGMRGGSLYSTVAVHQRRIVGFALAQLLPYPEQTEDKDLFPDYQFTPTYACYILTLGIVDEFRRLGLGTALIRNCEDHAKTFEDCGAVMCNLQYNSMSQCACSHHYHLHCCFLGLSTRHHLQCECYPVL
jgi:GNAT superfamily N-acetyltransferase